MKRKLFTFISENPLVAKLQYGMKVSIPFDLRIQGRVDMCADYVYLHPHPFRRQRQPSLPRPGRTVNEQEPGWSSVGPFSACTSHVNSH